MRGPASSLRRALPPPLPRPGLPAAGRPAARSLQQAAALAAPLRPQRPAQPQRIGAPRMLLVPPLPPLLQAPAVPAAGPARSMFVRAAVWGGNGGPGWRQAGGKAAATRREVGDPWAAGVVPRLGGRGSAASCLQRCLGSQRLDRGLLVCRCSGWGGAGERQQGPPGCKREPATAARGRHGLGRVTCTEMHRRQGKAAGGADS